MLIEEGSHLAIELTNKIIVKIYPKGNRFNSSNVDPIKFWNHGFQIGGNFDEYKYDEAFFLFVKKSVYFFI